MKFITSTSMCLVCLLGSGIAWAQTVELPPITIIGPETSAPDQVQKDVFAAAPERLAAGNSGVDVQGRMGLGWLQDVTIRGAVFEDANVRLNGVPLNNPQTGHFNLSFPGVATDIAGLDLQLNAQTLEFELALPHQEESRVRMSLGSGGFAESLMSMTRMAGEGYHRISFEGARTDGLRDETDGYRTAGSYVFYRPGTESDVLVYAAMSEKSFGENGAYAAPWYMREQETLRQEFFSGQWQWHRSWDVTLTPYLHRTQDTFWLDRDNPSGYRNDHTTWVGGNGLEFSDPQSGRFFKLEAQRDHLRSTNLGERGRFFYSGQMGVKTQYYQRWSYAAAVEMKYFNEYPLKMLPRLELGYQLTNFWRLGASAQRIYRQPSYTELYYNSVSNQGNPDLNPQTSDNAEIELSYTTGEIQFQTDVFFRHQQDTIDWVRNTADTVFQAVNAGTVDVRGFDVNFGLKTDMPVIQTVDVSYTYLDVQKEKVYDISKYVFDYLRDRLVLTLGGKPGPWDWALDYVYEYHCDLGDRWLINARLSYAVNPEMTVFLSGENLLDADYEEFPYIQGDPMFIKIGFDWKF